MTKRERFQHYVVNENGDVQWFFPMEVEVSKDDESYKDYISMLRGMTGTDEKYEIGMTKLGFREFNAIFIPVSKEQYDELIKDEMNKQEAMKQDGRCFIKAKKGGIRICPRRISNPKYVEGGSEPKTLAVSCEGCPYASKKNAHTVMNFSDLTTEDEDGNPMDYEVANPVGYDSTRQYDALVKDFLEYVRANRPKLTELAELLCQEYVQTEAASILGKSTSTIGSQTDKIKELLLEFLG